MDRGPQMPGIQTASSFCLRPCGVKSTVSERPNPADWHTLTLTHRGPSPVRSGALVARRAEIDRIQSASFRTSGKEIVTWFAGAAWSGGWPWAAPCRGAGVTSWRSSRVHRPSCEAWRLAPGLMALDSEQLSFYKARPPALRRPRCVAPRARSAPTAALARAAVLCRARGHVLQPCRAHASLSRSLGPSSPTPRPAGAPGLAAGRRRRWLSQREYKPIRGAWKGTPHFCQPTREQQ